MSDDDEMLLPDEDVPAVDEPGEPGEPGEGEDSFLDRLRGTAVGTEDLNIVGDAGPTDIPPGIDGASSPLVTTDEPVDHLEV